MAFTTIDIGGGTKITFDSNDPNDYWGDGWWIVVVLVILAVLVGLLYLLS